LALELAAEQSPVASIKLSGRDHRAIITLEVGWKCTEGEEAGEASKDRRIRDQVVF
jgi:hypothetical protein